MILLVNSLGTDKFLANSTIPVLSLQRLATIMQSNFNFPIKHVMTERIDMNGFILNDC